jgi:methylenetetrahydrofolate dehydrogenase (NADP+)/methenyltetrahydrofolate cyclohydrolase
MATIIDGKKTAQDIRNELKEIIAKSDIQPKLAVVLVGDDPASATYVKYKKKACEEIGVAHKDIEMPASTTEEELLKVVEELNADDSVNGILVQLPLPKQIDENKILLAIDPKKDVDGFHPTNVGRFVIGLKTLPPCTPAGVMELLKRYDIDTEGKNAVVVGRSNIVGKPASLFLLQANATVTIAHSRTKDLKKVCQRADILVSAAGRPRMISADMLKEGAVVIDVGTNWIEENGKRKLVGDVEFEKAREKVQAITPVPGGVGPMTIAMLMKNVCLAAGIEL